MTEERWQQNRRMVESQIIRRGIRDDRVIQAFMQVDRSQFVSLDTHHRAYSDHALPIGHEQTISQPYMVAYMTEALNLQGGEKVLEIGTGCGYQTAILASLAERVYTVERIPELAKTARTRLETHGFDNIEFRIGDGFEGWPEHAPFDRVIVTAAPSGIPEVLINQLRDTGYMIIPVGKQNHVQNLYRVVKLPGDYYTEDLGAVAFVPMLRGVEE